MSSAAVALRASKNHDRKHDAIRVAAQKSTLDAVHSLELADELKQALLAERAAHCDTMKTLKLTEDKLTEALGILSKTTP